jgi:hypothetical protein
MDENGVAGDFVECGVWRGGASIFARACLNPSRKVWLYDSFDGLPYDEREPEYSSMQFLKVSKQEVQRNFDRFELNHNVEFVPGYFCDTLKHHTSPISILRADGDMYSSTMDILNALYDKVSSGGAIIIDDYCLPPCAQAVQEYRSKHGITAPIIDIDGIGTYWIKP